MILSHPLIGIDLALSGLHEICFFLNLVFFGRVTWVFIQNFSFFLKNNSVHTETQNQPGQAIKNMSNAWRVFKKICHFDHRFQKSQFSLTEFLRVNKEPKRIKSNIHSLNTWLCVQDLELPWNFLFITTFYCIIIAFWNNNAFEA